MTRDNFTIVDNDVIDQIHRVGPVAFAVFVKLSRHANDSGECFPSLATIASAIGVTDRTVRTAVRVLEAAGLVATSRRRRDTTMYRILDRKPASDQEPILDRKPGTGQGVRPEKNDRLDRKPASGRTRPSNKTQEQERGVRGRAEDIPLPEGLQAEPFEANWAEWLAYRRERKLTLTPRTLTAQLKALDAVGPTQAAQAIQKSIQGGWAGLFPENGDRRNGNGKPKPATHRSGRIEATAEQLAYYESIS